MTLQELQAELATRRGFARRVQPPQGLRNFGGGVLVVLVLVGVMVLFERQWDAWPGLLAWGLLGLTVIVAGLLHERLRLRWIHTAYRERGWITAQAPTGLVRESGDSSSWLRRDSALTSGEADEHVEPVVLVGGPGIAPESIRSAADDVRERLTPLSKEAAKELCNRLPRALYGDDDVASHLPVPRGTRLAMRSGGSDFLVAVAPREGSRRRRPRYYGIRGSGTAR